MRIVSSGGGRPENEYSQKPFVVGCKQCYSTFYERNGCSMHAIIEKSSIDLFQDEEGEKKGEKKEEEINQQSVNYTIILYSSIKWIIK